MVCMRSLPLVIDLFCYMILPGVLAILFMTSTYALTRCVSHSLRRISFVSYLTTTMTLTPPLASSEEFQETEEYRLLQLSFV